MTAPPCSFHRDISRVMHGTSAHRPPGRTSCCYLCCWPLLPTLGVLYQVTKGAEADVAQRPDDEPAGSLGHFAERRDGDDQAAGRGGGGGTVRRVLKGHAPGGLHVE